jgi:DNA mismatch repair protein MutS
MIRQYLRIKSLHQDAILFFRMGDFYEMFFEDAEIASRILNIALTSRDKDKETPIPLCGIPYHSAESYIDRLVRDGRKVAICEQVEESRKSSKLVRREVVRVVTPGTILSEGFLSDKRNNFLGAVNPGSEAAGLAFLDISTGDFLAVEVPLSKPEELLSRLADFEPAELILPEGAVSPFLDNLGRAGLQEPSVVKLDDHYFETDRARKILLEHFQIASLEPFGLQENSETLIGAAGAVLHYALDTQKTALGHVDRLNLIQSSGYLQMDASTQRNLELLRSAVHGGREGTLLAVLDDTLTPMGGRLLRHWILHPLLDIPAIDHRLDGVAELMESAGSAGETREKLKAVMDLERFTSRLTLGLSGPRDLQALKETLSPLPRVREILTGMSSEVFRESLDRLDPLEDLHGLIERSIKAEPPATTRDGGFIKRGYDPELDELLDVKQKGRRWISELEQKERERTGISNLKIRYNRVFGYYIEVTKANLADVPEEYIRKQTLVAAERFTSAELSQYESKILEADERSLLKEQELFQNIREAILSEGERIRNTGQALAVLDVLQSLAATAVKSDYCRPTVDGSDIIDLKESRHPVVEAVNKDEPFIPNECYMDTGDSQILIITGPNMAGKSTYLRQVALTALMAQMGSFVPCRKARIGTVDRIFTRVGATDYLVRGQSTFMVEMTETAVILNNATTRSLVILDEIGRGTSTFDGLSIAWAVAEYLHGHSEVKARTLFATHYHQLTELSLTLPGVKNYSTAVREWGDRIIFLRRITEGGSDKSYGIQVARLAGLPPSVIERAREILANLEESELNTAGLPKLAGSRRVEEEDGPSQLYLFGAAEEEVIEELRRADVEGLSPLEALNFLARLVDHLRGKA